MEDENEVRVYTEQNENLKLISARLSNWHIRKAKKLGNGVLTEGLRIALEKVPYVKIAKSSYEKTERKSS